MSSGTNSVLRPAAVARRPYNPLDKNNLGEAVAQALLRTPARPLENTAHLVGAGVYAIYYTGRFAAYKQIRQQNSTRFKAPIYVGKAVPRGARKGGLSFDASAGKALSNRLRHHADSIDQVKTLDVRDFYFRALMVDDVWIPLGENVLIERFQPLWNRVIDGFGNHTPGKGRRKSKRSQWDTLHPGREFVRRLKLGPNPLDEAQIKRRIRDFFAGRLTEREKLPPEEEA